jgi:hypothetical protein
MPTNEHLLVKPEKLIETAVGMLEQELVIPNTFRKEGIDAFRGADDDTYSVTVEGVLPFREYEWRSGSASSSTPGTRSGIVFDQYSERKIPVTFGGNVYSAVKVTDEQYDMDLTGWAKILRPQVKAVARGLGRRAVNTLVGADYNVVVGDVEAQGFRSGLIEARRVLNAFNVPDEQRWLLVGSDFEAGMLNDDSLTLASNVGDSVAEGALRNATLGNLYGFNIVVDQSLPSDEAFAMVGSAFVFLSAAPSVPQSVPFGATQSFEDIALRWVRDYDSEHMHDRSVVNTYAGFRDVEDVLVGWDEDAKSEVVSEGEYLVRAIKLHLTDDSVYPAATDELAVITGVSEENAYAAQTIAPAPIGGGGGGGG